MVGSPSLRQLMAHLESAPTAGAPGNGAKILEGYKYNCDYGDKTRLQARAAPVGSGLARLQLKANNPSSATSARFQAHAGDIPSFTLTVDPMNSSLRRDRGDAGGSELYGVEMQMYYRGPNRFPGAPVHLAEFTDKWIKLTGRVDTSTGDITWHTIQEPRSPIYQSAIGTYNPSDTTQLVAGNLTEHHQEEIAAANEAIAGTIINLL